MDKLIYSVLIEHNSTITQLLNKAEIYIIPLLNPDGHSILWWYPYQRKNLRIQDDDDDGTTDDEYEVQVVWDQNQNRSVEIYNDSDDPDTEIGEDAPGGVDLNRNYDFEWYGPGSSTEKNVLSLKTARIHLCMACTPCSTIPLSCGFLGLAGSMVQL